MIELTLYSRPECHLCDTMLDELAPLLDGRAKVSVIDISTNRELERELGQKIPVLRAGDVELSRYRLDAGRVQRYLSRNRTD